MQFFLALVSAATNISKIIRTHFNLTVFNLILTYLSYSSHSLLAYLGRCLVGLLTLVVTSVPSASRLFLHGYGGEYVRRDLLLRSLENLSKELTFSWLRNRINTYTFRNHH